MYERTAAGTFVVNIFFDNALRQPPLCAVEGLKLLKVGVLIVASRELVNDSQIGTVIVLRSQ
jgi:hypothetical protein